MMPGGAPFFGVYERAASSHPLGEKGVVMLVICPSFMKCMGNLTTGEAGCFPGPPTPVGEVIGKCLELSAPDVGDGVSGGAVAVGGDGDDNDVDMDDASDEEDDDDVAEEILVATIA